MQDWERLGGNGDLLGNCETDEAINDIRSQYCKLAQNERKTGNDLGVNGDPLGNCETDEAVNDISQYCKLAHNKYNIGMTRWEWWSTR